MKYLQKYRYFLNISFEIYQCTITSCGCKCHLNRTSRRIRV